MSIDSISTSSAAAQRTESARPMPRTDVLPTKAGSVSPQQQDIAAQQVRQQENAQQSQQAGRQDVDEAVDRLNNFVSNIQSEINFSIDETTGIRIVKVVDSNSNEVIRQMPSEEAVALAKALDKLQGLLIKEKA